jgi:hypothetical protein
MSEYQATSQRQRTSPDFLRGKFSREHTFANSVKTAVTIQPR